MSRDFQHGISFPVARRSHPIGHNRYYQRLKCFQIEYQYDYELLKQTNFYIKNIV